MSDLKAAVGVDFSLLGTRLHAAYEKNGEKDYAVLLVPSEQNADNGISIGQLVKDIQGLVKGVDEKADTSGMEKDLQSGMDSLVKEDGDKSFLDKLIIKLQMAYLYIRKKGDESVLEYAFQLQILSTDVIPKEIQSLVNVDSISISVWNTSRQKVLDKMALMTIDDYIGATKGIEDKESEEETQPE